MCVKRVIPLVGTGTAKETPGHIPKEREQGSHHVSCLAVTFTTQQINSLRLSPSSHFQFLLSFPFYWRKCEWCADVISFFNHAQQEERNKRVIRAGTLKELGRYLSSQLILRRIPLAVQTFFSLIAASVQISLENAP